MQRSEERVIVRMTNHTLSTPEVTPIHTATISPSKTRLPLGSRCPPSTSPVLVIGNSFVEHFREHLRGPGPHVRGCWAVDFVLGRE
jgi:hypothetical protein